MITARRLIFNVAVGFLSFVVLPGCQRSTTPPPPSGPSKSVGALARLQPGDGVINVGVTPGERLQEVLVHENDSQPVRAKDLLARLGSYPLRKADYDLAVSQRDEARAQLAAIRANGAEELAQAKVRRQIVVEVEPLDIKAQKDKVAYLEKQLATAQDNLSRLQSLQKATVSAQQLEQQQLLVSQAESELNAARSLLDKAVRAHDLNVQAADAQLRVIETTLKATEQKVPLESLERTVAVAAERLALSEVRAPEQPAQMVVLEVLGRPGELTTGQPVFRLGDTSQMYAIAQVYETDVHRVRPGQSARITSHALEAVLQNALQKDYLPGVVEWVGRTVSRNSLFAVNPAAETDRRVVEVKIRLERSDVVAGFVNMEVNVAIDVEN
jgi:HlyD family secretion protein